MSEDLDALVDKLVPQLERLLSDLRAALGVEPLLTIDEVAAVLKVSRDMVYKLMREGVLPTVRVGERTRFRAADMRAYIDRCDSEQAS